MDHENLLEFLIVFLALVYFIARGIYRRLRVRASGRRSPVPATLLAPPIPALTQPTSRPLRGVASQAALGCSLAVILASLAFAVWVSSQVSVPPNVELAAAFFPLWFCVGAPLLCAFSAIAVTITDNSFRELQTKPLPRGIPLIIGALIGLAFSLASASLIPAITCGVVDAC